MTTLEFEAFLDLLDQVDELALAVYVDRHGLWAKGPFLDGNAEALLIRIYPAGVLYRLSRAQAALIRSHDERRAKVNNAPSLPLP